MSWFSELKSKFRRKRRNNLVDIDIDELKTRGRELARKTNKEINRQVIRMKTMIRRMRYHDDRRKIPIYLLTFDEIDELMKESPFPFSGADIDREYLDLRKGRF
jgi:hypothetical protein